MSKSKDDVRITDVELEVPSQKRVKRKCFECYRAYIDSLTASQRDGIGPQSTMHLFSGSATSSLLVYGTP